MINDNARNFSRLQMLIDLIIIIVSYLLGWWIRFRGPFAYSAVETKTLGDFVMLLIVIVPGYMLLYRAFDLYATLRMQ